MTAATKIDRSGPAIHATLAELSADECAQFEHEFQEATQRAAQTFDLAPTPTGRRAARDGRVHRPVARDRR